MRINQLLKKTILLSLLIVLTGCASAPLPLYDAVPNAPVEEIRRLIDSGADLDKGGFWGAPIYRAIISRDADDPDLMPIVKTLLEAGASPDGGLGDPSYFAALHVASGHALTGNLCNPELINLLLDAGANVNKNGGYNDTPLFYAAKEGQFECAQLLIERGANIQQGRTRWGYGNSSIEEEIEKQGWDMAELLQLSQQGIDDRAMDAQRAQEEALRAEVQAEENAFQSQLDSSWNRDTSLSPAIRRDKYLIAFSNAMKEQRYEDANFAALLLERNGLGIDDSLYYFWGEALLELGDTESSLEKLSTYLNLTGTQGTYYAQTLGLMLQAEGM